MRILAVDDSAAMRRIIRTHLRQAGHEEVDEADSGRAALALLDRAPYDLLIAAWTMPEMSGLDLVREVRRRDAGRRLPILVVTTVSSREDIEAALRAGVTGYLVKPFDGDTLRGKVTQAVGAR
jgi:two-component system chemotaxis response regulator CheY